MEMTRFSDLAIRTRGLRKVFGGKVAVRNLTLDVPRGEVFGFLGPNGAGKSTSVKMLLGLVLPTSGEAQILGCYAMAGVTARHLARGLSLMWMESIVLLSVVFVFATYFSTLTTGVLTLGLHGLAFLGGWIEQFGAITQTPRAVNVGIIASVLMPSEALWRRAAFEMQSPLANSLRISPFSTLSVPSMAMVFYALLYLAIALAVAIRRFSQRDL